MSNDRWSPSRQSLLRLKAAVFVACSAPLASLLWAFHADRLGANPIEAITHGTGTWALRLLLITLLITPLRSLRGLRWLVQLRRMLGLFAFLYALLHLGCYLWLDQFFAWDRIAGDILARPFIAAGFAAFALLIPLAATSCKAAITRLGGRRWQALHRLVYASAMLAVLHYGWLVKRDLTQPLLYGLILVLLLTFRIAMRENARRRWLHEDRSPQFCPPGRAWWKHFTAPRPLSRH